ncbi:MAG TPA: hypothetical protein PLA90_09750 [Candidatus Sumerlaeota bacterium]|nr:hypothetical protein [Candidatus Sumerlaeota bacterium]HPS01815.1 hypothetical protein [Candidatus Sumerlaeota bacterium]
MFESLGVSIQVAFVILLGIGLSTLLIRKARRISPLLISALTLAMIHLLLVLLNGISIWQSLAQGHGEALMGWLLFDFIDLPSSLLLLAADEWFCSQGTVSFMMRNFWLPLAFFSIAGTLQYFAMGVTAGWIAKVLQRRIRTQQGKTEENEGM